jgi:hypothetical protein
MKTIVIGTDAITADAVVAEVFKYKQGSRKLNRVGIIKQNQQWQKVIALTTVHLQEVKKFLFLNLYQVVRDF